MTRWKSLNRPKSSGFHPGRTFAPEICFVRPLSGAMLYAYNRPEAAIDGYTLKRTLDKLAGRFAQNSGYPLWTAFRTTPRVWVRELTQLIGSNAPSM